MSSLIILPLLYGVSSYIIKRHNVHYVNKSIKSLQAIEPWIKKKTIKNPQNQRLYSSRVTTYKSVRNRKKQLAPSTKGLTRLNAEFLQNKTTSLFAFKLNIYFLMLRETLINHAVRFGCFNEILDDVFTVG